MYKQSIYNNLVKHHNAMYIYNSKTKASVLINSKIDFENFLNRCNNSNQLNVDEIETKKMLIDNGILILDSTDELKQMEYIFKKVYFNASNLDIILVPTLQCNFKCPYCFEEGNRNTVYKSNYFEVLKKFADKKFKFFSHVHISMFGGEPLLKEKELFDFLEYVYNRKDLYGIDLTTSIVTNGSLVTEETIKQLVKYSCEYFQITLDGCEDIHDSTRIFKNGKKSFKLLIDKINTIAKLTASIQLFKLTVRINLNNVSVNQVRDTLLQIDKNYRDKISILFRPIYNTSEYVRNNINNTKELEVFYELAQELGFNILKSTFYFKTCESCGDDNEFYLTPDLKMWKCMNDLTYDNANIGRIDDEGEIDIDPEKIMNWSKAANCFKDKQCQECSMLPDCFGGCVLYSSKNGKRKCKNFEMACLPYFY